MRRKHLVLIPVILIVGLVLWAITQFDNLPQFARWAGAGIAVLAAFIFIIKHAKMERDLKGGVVQIIEGRITKKNNFGGEFRTPSSGVSRGRGHKGSGATYFIYIDNEKFNVPSKIFSKVEEGDKVVLNYFPKSQFYLDIHVVKSE